MGKKKGMDKETKTFVIIAVILLVIGLLLIALSTGISFGNLMGTNSDILRPDGDIYNSGEGFYTTRSEVNFFGGTTFYNCVNEYVMDGNISYIRFLSYQGFTQPSKVIFGLTPMPKNETINKIIVHCEIEKADVSYWSGPSLARPFLNFETTEFTIRDDWLTSRGYAHNYNTINNTMYNEFTDTWYLNPKTNQPWTTNDLNTLNIGFEMKLGSYSGSAYTQDVISADCHLTQLYVEVFPALTSKTTYPPVASPSGTQKQTPGFETLTFVVAIGIALVLLNKKRNKKELN